MPNLFMNALRVAQCLGQALLYNLRQICALYFNFGAQNVTNLAKLTYPVHHLLSYVHFLS